MDYPTVFPTVDVVILRNDTLLLGRKAHQDKFRFIGGFADPALDNSYEDAAKREAKEETGLDVHEVKYLGSTRIDDPRYRGSVHCIITHLFITEDFSGVEKANDDIAELKWVKRNELTKDMLVKEHDVLFDLLNSTWK